MFNPFRWVNARRFRILAVNSHSGVRLSVAKDARADAGVLDMLAKDAFYFIRAEVARNANTSFETLEVLFCDDVALVAREAAANPLFDTGMLRDIVASTNVTGVLLGVVKNPNVSLDVLCHLISGENLEVVGAVWDKLLVSSDEVFSAVLHNIGRGDLVGLPRGWVRQAVSYVSSD